MLVSSAGPPTLGAVASKLRLNARTLQRRLSAQSLAFQTLLDDCRQRRAINELVGSRRSVARIAARLGYSGPAHFSRAFRRWTGYSPTEYRQALARHRVRVDDRTRRR